MGSCVSPLLEVSAAVQPPDLMCSSYSGDTMPNDAFIDAGQHVNLLIHEASMANDQEEMASKKGHSTFGQALDVAKRCVVFNLRRTQKLTLVMQDERSQRAPHTLLGTLSQDDACQREI